MSTVPKLRRRPPVSSANAHPDGTQVWPVVREQQKEGRRETIFAAAEALIRETGSTDFSVGALALRADLSVATLYNLIGSKGAILYVLLNRSMDQLAAATTDDQLPQDPFEAALQAADRVAHVYVSDSDYLRPLWRFELGVVEPDHRPALMNRALAFWASRLQALEKGRCLPKGIGLQDMAREYQIFFAGALDLWVQHELSDTQFPAQIRYGCLLRLLALGDTAAQPRLMRELRKVHAQLQELANAV